MIKPEIDKMNNFNNKDFYNVNNLTENNINCKEN